MLAKNQHGFTIIEAVIIVVALAVVGLGGNFVWQKHQVSAVSNKAHAGAYGALIGQYMGTQAFACQTGSNIKVTVWRTTADASLVSSTSLNTAQAYGPVVGTNQSSSWLYGVVQSYLVPFNHGEDNYIQGVFTLKQSTATPSITNKYTGTRLNLKAGYLPATDGLPFCS